MLFFLLTAIGASVALQHRIRAEHEGLPSWMERRKRVAQLEAQFRTENELVDRELANLLEVHRTLVARRESVLPEIREEDYAEALDELERELGRDPLEDAFRSLEESDGEEKKKKDL
jgi:hypothetical protein